MHEPAPDTKLLYHFPQDSNSILSSPETTVSEISPESLSGDEGEPRKELPDSKKSSFAVVLFNLSNTIVGGSVMALPYVVRQLGIITGSIILILGAVLITYCSTLLQKTKNLSRHSNYVTIARYCLGTKAEAVLSICLLISNLGSCIVFLSIFALVVQNILGYSIPACSADAPFYCQRSFLVGIGGLITLPFTFPKNIAKLKIISFFKTISVSIYAIITISHCVSSIQHGTYARDAQLWPAFENPVDMLGSIAEVILAYIFTYNQFSIYKSMRKPSDASFNKAVRLSMGTIAVIFIMIGISGYLIFGAQTNNILQNFTLKELGPGLFLVLNISFMVFSITSYPPAFFAPRNVLYMMTLKYFGGSKVVPKDNGSCLDNESNQRSEANSRRANIIYTAVVLISNSVIIIIAIFAPSINDLFGIMGSIAANALVFLFPPAFYLRLTSKRAKERGLAKLMFGIGVVVGVVGFVCNIIKIFVEGE